MIMVPYGWTPSVAAGHKNADLWHPTGSTPGRKSRQRPLTRVGGSGSIVHIKRLRAIAAPTQARWLNMEGYARLCIYACIGNVLISADPDVCPKHARYMNIRSADCVTVVPPTAQKALNNRVPT